MADNTFVTHSRGTRSCAGEAVGGVWTVARFAARIAGDTCVVLETAAGAASQAVVICGTVTC